MAPKIAVGPIRTCAGCRTRRPRNELLRVVAGREGLWIDGSGARPAGRGAYLCPTRACIETAIASARLARALKYRGAVPADARERLLMVLGDGGRDDDADGAADDAKD